MTTRFLPQRSKVAGQGRPVTTFLPAWLLLFSASSAQSDPGDRPELIDKPFDPFATQNLGRAGQWNLALASAVAPQATVAGEAQATAGELAAGLGVEDAPSQRRFHVRAMDWIDARSAKFGSVVSFFVGGGDSGWQLTVDPVDKDEYQLEWKARFR
jgi:hypothetical protein